MSAPLRTSPPDEWLTCDRCDGEGVINTLNSIFTLPCPECGGEGLINREDDYT